MTGTTYPTGFDLLDRLKETGMRPVPRTSICNTFDSYVETDVSEAQRVLLDSGYRLDSCEMIEHEAYTMKFRSPGNEYPYSVLLRYFNGGSRWPYLALCYIKGRQLVQFRSSFKDVRMQSVHGTDSIHAETLMKAFRDELPDRHPFWVPVLERSPLVEP